MNEHTFEMLRNISVFLAGAMLIKYVVFLIVSPFYSIKEALRRKRFSKTKASLDQTAYDPKVSIIVPAWNEEVGILRTVRSLLLNTYKNIEIVIINDGSSDNSHRRVQGYVNRLKLNGRPEANRIAYFYKENGGKGAALNYGIRRATGDIIVTMDADSVFDKFAIERIVQYFRDPSVDALVGNVKVGNSHGLIGYIQSLEYLFGFYFKRAHCVLGAEYIFGGACAAFRRTSVFDRLGHFDDSSKTEDIEMSLRTKYYGMKSVYADDVVCYTEGAASIRGLLNQRLRWKKGRFDAFGKYRRMFFSFDKRHNKMLSWFIMPYCMLSEFQLLFEPIGITLLLTYSFLSGDFISLTLGILFIFITYLVVSIFSHQNIQWKLLLSFPFTWPLFYFLVWVEYVALVKSLFMIARGEDIEWQQWDRQGVGENS